MLTLVLTWSMRFENSVWFPVACQTMLAAWYHQIFLKKIEGAVVGELNLFLPDSVSVS